MKQMKIKYWILSILISIFAVSCQEEVVVRELHLIPFGTVHDGGYISGIYVECLEDHVTPAVYEEYAKTHYIKDYADVTLTLNLKHVYNFRYLDEYSYDFGRQYFTYMEDKSSFILEACNQYRKETNPDYGWPYLFSAYINGEVSISCDKTLFGEVPGTNLSNHFKVLSRGCCIPSGIDEPKLRYNFGEIKHALNMPEYFADKDWMMGTYYILFEDFPAEKYDKLTFRIKMPVLCENTVNRLLNQNSGTELLDVFEEKEFETEFYLLFDWN